MTLVNIEHKYFNDPYLDDPINVGVKLQPCAKENANLVSSETDIGCHLPVLDIDYSAELISSTTEGHFHLYLNKPVSWGKYMKVLKALYKADLIEKGFYENSIRRGATFVRPPGVKKTDYSRSSESNW